MLITVPYYFQIFCQDKLAFNYAVKLYDPLSKMFEIYVDTDESLRMVLFGFSRYIPYYGLTGPCYLHLNYVGNNVFLHRIFSAEGLEMDYNRDSGNAANSQVPVAAPDFEKVLSNYDVKASSLVRLICIVLFSYLNSYLWWLNMFSSNVVSGFQICKRMLDQGTQELHTDEWPISILGL